MVATGDSRSTLRPLTVALRVLPALSRATPVTDWFAPLVARVWSAVHPPSPDNIGWSAQVKWTVTGDRYQPALFGTVVAAPAIDGELLSSRTIAVWADSAFPALSTLQYWMVC